MRFKVLWIAGLMLAATAGQVQAAFLNSATGLASPTTTITFSEFGVAIGAVVTNQYSALGATFGSLSASEGLYQTNNGNPGTGLQNYFPDTYNPFSIKFATARTAVAFQMITNNSTDIFEALLNNVVVETANQVTGTWKYYGFTGIVFDEIRVNIGGVAVGSGGKHMRLDNLQLGTAAAPVPEPTSIAMWGIGAIGMMFTVRKRRQMKLAA